MESLFTSYIAWCYAVTDVDSFVRNCQCYFCYFLTAILCLQCYSNIMLNMWPLYAETIDMYRFHKDSLVIARSQITGASTKGNRAQPGVTKIVVSSFYFIGLCFL